MSRRRAPIGSDRLAVVIREVASSIGSLEAARRQQPDSEAEVWRILACCIFGSASRYEDAVRAVDVIVGAGITDPSEHGGCLASCVAAAIGDGRQRGERVRFGRTRARQLAEAYAAIRREWGGLIGMLSSGHPAKELRAWLIDSCPGLGAKQASLFLRDAGYTKDLAVIDRHITTYMAIAGLGSGVAPRTRYEYEAAEERLSAHAIQLGMTLAVFDQATWVVGRVMSRWK